MLGALAVAAFGGVSQFLLFFVIVLIACVERALRTRYLQKGGFSMLRLKLSPEPVAVPVLRETAVATPASVVRKSLCAACAYSRIVLGYSPGDSLLTCGYAFPPQSIPFAVRECTDFRPKRETRGAADTDAMAAVERRNKQAKEGSAEMAPRN